ncbi:MAG: 5'-nucleotidase C-terminal domain-containing protein [Bacillus sp. (in: firmicutes)]
MSNNQTNIRKFAAGAATITMVASAVAPAAAAGFKDVDTQYKDAVDFVVSKGIQGLTKDEFGVHKEIKRADAAVMLVKVLGLDLDKAPPSGFSDIPKRAVPYVNAMKAAGITAGKTKTSFGAHQSVTRGELAIWIQKGFQLKGRSTMPFQDVSDRYIDAVQALVDHGIAKGLSTDRFGTDQKSKRGDFAMFLKQAGNANPAMPTPIPSEPFTLSIMHTNDTHAHIEQVAKRVTAIKEVRAKKPHALLLDGGDVFSGTLYFNEFKGQADLAFMNMMKYDAMTLGNHEFDLGASPEGHKALAEFVKGASFPIVSANVNLSKDLHMKGLFKDSMLESPASGLLSKGIVKSVNGEKVGIFGLTTEETRDISSPVAITFSDYIEEATEAVAAFEKQGINKIVALTHIGYDDNPAVDNDRELAAKVDGIDVIVGGHSHTQLDKPVVIDKDDSGDKKAPTVIVQAYQYGEFLGTVDVEFDQKGKVIGQAGELIKIADQVEDKEAQAKLKPYKDKISDVMNTSTGATAVQALENPRVKEGESDKSVRKNETELGNLITDGMLDKAKAFNKDTVIAFQNGGGIRAGIDQGEVTLGDILTVLPFGNTLATMTLKGTEIIEALEHSVSAYPKESGGFLHVSGLKYTFNSSKPAGERIQKVEVKGADGTFAALDVNKEYVVATNAFTAKGGDGFDVFKKAYEAGRVTDLGLSDWENLKEYVAKLKTVEPKLEGRMTEESGAK